MRVVINGHEMNFSDSGNSICVSGNGNVIINGKTISGDFVEGKTIDIHVDGNVKNIETTGSVTVNGEAGYIECGGSATVHGNTISVNAGGSVHVDGHATGKINAGGSVHCG